MADPLWSRISELVARALELPAGERAAFIAREVDDDPMREEVASLVNAAASEGDWLARLSDRIWRPRLASASSEPPMVGRRIGPWRLLELIGRGGMGTVYLAERADGAFEQQVALKLLGSPLLDSEGKRRFTAERQILARLEHPAIARLLDGGITDGGVPWFAMEYVEGVAITDYCDGNGLSLDERLALFEEVCRAVEYAHHRLIIHRDLKPSNILITANGEPRLLDFGLAKLLQKDPGGESPFTHPEGRWMTLAYASPEQVKRASPTAASDTYQLGFILYEILTGRRPYTLKGLSSSEAKHVICEVDPPLPSAAVAAGHVSLMRKRLRGDLDAIIMKALHKDPDHGYASAETMANDLERHRKRLPIRARPSTPSYRAQKLVQRHRWSVLAGVLVFLSLLGGLAGTVWQAKRATENERRATENERRAVDQQEEAEAISEFLLSVFSVADPEEARGEKVTARELLDRGARRARTELADQPAVQAAMLHTLGRAYRSMGLADRADTLLSQALRLRRGGDGGDVRELAETLHELGRARLDRGEPESAEKLLREALKRYRGLPVETPAAQAATLFHLAAALSARNDFAGAEEALREAWTLQRNLGDRTAVAETLYAWGVVAQHLGRFEDSWQHNQEAFEIYRRIGRTHSPEYAQALLSMATVRLGRTGNTQKLELDWTQEALALRRQIYGSDHPLVSEALLIVASVAVAVERPEMAERRLRQALRIEERHTKGSERHLEALTKLGRLLIQQGRAAEGMKRLEQAVTVSADRPGSFVHIMALNGIGDALRLAGRLEEAERSYRQRLGLCRQVFDRDHPLAIRAEVDLARVDLAREEFAAAERTLRRALKVYRKLVEPDYFRTALFEVDLGQALVGLGRDAEAEPLLRHAAPVLREVYGPEHRCVQRADELLASLSTTTEHDG